MKSGNLREKVFDKIAINVRTSDGRYFTLLEDLTYTASDGTIYTVPAGSITDGASSPKEVWDFIPPFGYYWLAAVFHDWLYHGSHVPKSQCDSLFKEAMLSLSVEHITAQILYEAVHLFGWRAYTSDRRK